VQYYRASKAEILQLRHDHEKAEYSRTRFEARQERLEKEDAEKEAKRAARKKAAQEKARKAADSGNSDEDPIQAAIERAKAKKAAQQAEGSNESELEKLEKAVVTTRKRLDTATAKLEQAKAEGSDLVDALQTGVDKTTIKVNAAEQALVDYQKANTSDTDEAPTADPAQVAIQKAMASRAVEAALDPADKARINLEKLQQRLQKSQNKLVDSRDNGDEEKIIEALELSVTRMTEKVAEAQRQLREEESA
jgi:electron transport complex protein RnfC